MASSIHFSDRELCCHHGINLCTQKLVDALEQFRAMASALLKRDAPVFVTDATRCKWCNEALKNAARNSQHLLGNAADIRVLGLTAAQMEALATRIPTINGIGRDDLKNYIHVDVRLTPARWCYDKDGEQTAWYAPRSVA